MQVFGLILDGGSGRRLGGTDKALIDLGGRPILSWVADRFAPQVTALALSSNRDAQVYARFGLPVLHDGMLAGEGPLAGVLAGLRWAAAGQADALVTVAGDTPFLPGDLVSRLIEAAGPGGAALASSPTGLHPTFGLWPAGCAGRLAQFLMGSERRIRRFAQSLGAAEAGFEGEPDPFFNINTPEDMAVAAQIVAR